MAQQNNRLIAGIRTGKLQPIYKACPDGQRILKGHESSPDNFKYLVIQNSYLYTLGIGNTPETAVKNAESARRQNFYGMRPLDHFCIFYKSCTGGFEAQVFWLPRKYEEDLIKRGIDTKVPIDTNESEQPEAKIIESYQITEKPLPYGLRQGVTYYGKHGFEPIEPTYKVPRLARFYTQVVSIKKNEILAIADAHQKFSRMCRQEPLDTFYVSYQSLGKQIEVVIYWLDKKHANLLNKREQKKIEGKSLDLLLIEDNPDIAINLSNTLAGEDHTILIDDSASDIVYKFHITSPDVVLLNDSLNVSALRKTGELMDAMKFTSTHRPVLVYTYNRLDEYVLRGYFNAGVSRVVKFKEGEEANKKSTLIKIINDSMDGIKGTWQKDFII